ncbi:MAG TPA: gfo/Idh/MocA family oxidoreductase, partial [Pirellulaceae bacterium]|nr:gfo/Idh/MocA family oxidoreductase [Pirellulaceae bacterium]
RALTRLAKTDRLATQMGTQIHASDHYRRVVELVRSGAIGEVHSVYTWCNKGWSDGRFGVSQAPPAYIDWDLWLGPAATRPYYDNLHPANWRRFWEYGSGTFGDMACHIMDLPFWALELRYPSRVTCEGPERHPDGAPAWTKATYDFPRHGGGAIKLHWSDGGAHFDVVQETMDRNGEPLSQWGLGVLFVGSQGMLVADYGRRQLLPHDRFADFEPPQPSIPPSAGHWNEWVEACKTGSPTTCNFEYAGALTEAVLLGIVAFRTGQSIEWDADRMAVTNTSEAEPFLTKQYRPGFEVVGLE